MTNEAVLRVETGLPVNMTCADGTGIERGAILKLTDPNTCALSDGTGDVVAGIAAGEKIANNGQTKIAVYREGHFIVKGSGSITVGDPLKSAAGTETNTVVTAATNDEAILGIALETATAGEDLVIELRPTTMQLA